MAPEPRRKPRENQYIFQLGVRGRKTGLTVPDTGIRDEHGLEPMDHLFSSPQKSGGSRTSRRRYGVNGKTASDTLSSDDMDVAESTVPEPAAVISERKRASVRLPPRSKSPIKTYLQSPARRNPSLGPVSSPIRGTIVGGETRELSSSAFVRRRLDFSQGAFAMEEELGNPVGSSKKQSNGSAKLTNGGHLSPYRGTLASSSLDNEDDRTQQVPNNITDNPEESYQLVNGDDEDEVAVVAEPVPTKYLEPLRKRGRGRPKVVDALPEDEETVLKKSGPGRPRKEETSIDQRQLERATKRTRRSIEARTDDETLNSKSHLQKSKVVRGKPQLVTISEDSPQLQRGPPMPRRPGLMTIRRETPMEGNAFKQTRSGRNSIKPLAFWRNERLEYSEDEIEDSVGRFLMPTIKGVVRVDEIVEQKRRSRQKSKSKKRRAESDDEDEAEPWELEPGRISGDVLTWDPADPTGAQADDVEEELALSSAAIITRDIVGSSFKFAKTLTLPFFGSGMVDLPPGSIKKPKNSRKMQMAFFVFYGRVRVTVNGNEFRISKGGMWQVPRGNTYSIENDYDSPARIFFSQGCEVSQDMDETK